MPITLENDYLRTTIDPDQGTSLHSFQVRRENAWLSLMPDVDDPACDLAAASFLMIPYSNRIADGAFAFADQSYQLNNANQHAIHGDVRKRPWVIAEQSPQRLVCTFDSADQARSEYEKWYLPVFPIQRTDLNWSKGRYLKRRRRAACIRRRPVWSTRPCAQFSRKIM